MEDSKYKVYSSHTFRKRCTSLADCYDCVVSTYTDYLRDNSQEDIIYFIAYDDWWIVGFNFLDMHRNKFYFNADADYVLTSRKSLLKIHVSSFAEALSESVHAFRNSNVEILDMSNGRDEIMNFYTNALRHGWNP